MRSPFSRRCFVQQGSLAVLALAQASVFSATPASKIQISRVRGVQADALAELVAFIAGEVGKSVPGAALIASRNAAQMAEAKAQGQAPVHQSWGLGPLLRGPLPKGEAWFGFRDVKNPAVFGHAGIDTVIGTGDPEKQVALFFATTDSPNPKPKTEELRNGVTNRILAAVG